jgi:hypothetical protein
MDLYKRNMRSGNTQEYNPRNLPFDDWVNPENLKKIVPIFKDFEFQVNTDEYGNGGFTVSQ